VRDLLDQRAALLRKLGSTHVLPDTLVLRLLQKTGPQGACIASGLRRYLDLAHLAPALCRPLTEHDKFLAAPFGSAEAKPTHKNLAPQTRTAASLVSNQ
jgi:hypothetical protein